MSPLLLADPLAAVTAARLFRKNPCSELSSFPLFPLAKFPSRALPQWPLPWDESSLHHICFLENHGFESCTCIAEVGTQPGLHTLALRLAMPCVSTCDALDLPERLLDFGRRQADPALRDMDNRCQG